MTQSEQPLTGLRIGLLSAWASRLNGGVFEAVVAQSRIIRELGGEPVVFGLSNAHADDDRAAFAPSAVHNLATVGPAQIGFAPGLSAALLGADLDILHVHGVWMGHSRSGLHWARQSGKPYVISPHGMLDPWITARGKAKKALARTGYERANWRAAWAFHALTAHEAQDIERETGRQGRAIVIPNASPTADPQRDFVRDARQPQFLYLGRIHPKKNIGRLIEAWNAQQPVLKAIGAELIIAGWGAADDVAALERQVASASESVRFVGPVYGADKAALFRSSRFFVLPSQSEGLPMVILEAWAVGTPTLMSGQCNLPEGYEAGAALDCGQTVDSIGAVLAEAAQMAPQDWASMAASATGLATGAFSSAQVSRKWGEAYAKLATSNNG